MTFWINARNALVVAVVSLFCSQAMAGVVITGTRIVYPAGQKEVSVKLNNNGSLPALVQSWIDTGDAKADPTNSKAPFMLSPPVSRIDPGKGQTLRLMFLGADLPTSKESVFWLNVLEIPPKAQGGGDANVLQMAFRSRIKIFYRPAQLPGKSLDAPAQLQWSVVKVGSGFALRARNSSPYYVSTVGVALVAGATRYPSEDGMVAPGESHDYPLPTLRSEPGSAQVEFEAINDYGALVKHNASLAR
ncbi:chaperone protein EcpD [Pseudomonas delhiensis]|uniref:Chaperone protein EcpD n=1 Tax=Pseudomonas delhiensis TaxID=366289 RepID=A0A239KCN0_9PSED|nr:fimbria/pilus periplasmic chaperone [Pseudomonas delhiensis]SDJ30799.1 chaperone protein EcpD [Pseudomonas delhiensis]SNT15881.1 chaperone protein EcpD [Pseudomonas delhiensis]